MNSPITGKSMTLIKEKKILEFRKESFEIMYHSYKCVESGEEFVDERLDDLNLDQVYNAFRVRHRLPFTEEIKEIRRQYGLPATAMSEVLGFGINQYRLYETGEIPSETNGRLIQLAASPEEFLRLVELSNVLESKQKEKLLKRIDEIKQARGAAIVIAEKTLGVNVPSVYNGYRKTSPEKAYQMIRFFADTLTPLKTSLNKLLFYADFYHFKRFGMGISGLQYRAIQWGPVPSQFDYLFKLAEENKSISLKYELWDGDKEMVIIEPSTESLFRAELFTEEEIKSLQDVLDKFKTMKTKQLVEVSHNEPGWKDNFEEKKLINYAYAFDLCGL